MERGYALRDGSRREERGVLTATVGIFGTLAVLAWLVIAWASNRRQPWLLSPLVIMALTLLVLGHPGWALLPLAVLVVGSFAELVIGAREAPTIRARESHGPLSTERWAMAVAAPFRVALAEPWDVVVRPGLRRRYRAVLAAEWGVVDRDSLLAAVENQWAQLHAAPDVDLVIDLCHGTACTRAGEDGAVGRSVVLCHEQLGRLREATGVDDAAAAVTIGSYQWWKAAHLIRLACAGAALDWLSSHETHRLLRQVAADLQRRYGCWTELAQAFHAGYLLSEAGQSKGVDSERFWTALGILMRDTNSPWNLLPWDMPLDQGSRAPGAPSSTRP